MDDPVEYSTAEGEAIRAGLHEIALGSVATLHPAFAYDELGQLWLYGEYSSARTPRFSLAPPEWTLGMTDNFTKAIRGIERTLQGRVLEALSHIVEGPTSPRGDTLKPLSGNFKELWRYRIGDYRLVYRPDPASRQIILLAFTPRSDSYR